MYYAGPYEHNNIQRGSLQQSDDHMEEWARSACAIAPLHQYMLWASEEWHAPYIVPDDIAKTPFTECADDFALFKCIELSSTGSSPEAAHFFSPYSSVYTDDGLDTTAHRPDCAPISMHNGCSSGPDTGAHLAFPADTAQSPRGGVAFRSEVGSQAQAQAAKKRRASARLPNQGYICDQCHKTFTRKKNLIDHIQRHRNLKAFGCHEHDCQSRFNTKSDLERHFKTVHTTERPNKKRE